MQLAGSKEGGWVYTELEPGVQNGNSGLQSPRRSNMMTAPNTPVHPVLIAGDIGGPDGYHVGDDASLPLHLTTSQRQAERPYWRSAGTILRLQKSAHI